MNEWDHLLITLCTFEEIILGGPAACQRVAALKMLSSLQEAATSADCCFEGIF